MKLRATIYDSRRTAHQQPTAAFSANRQSPIGNRQSGIALVITLILLAVTLVMAIAFLAISRRERRSVGTETDATTARLAADAALAHAEAQIVDHVLITSNAFDAGLLVSTNYINGFYSGVAALTNVNYVYTNGSPLSQDDFVQSVADLFYSPRPPVFIVTNTQTGASDFRYYLDLNRNGDFDPSGWVAETNLSGLGTGTFSYEEGDPQWIGILARPDAPHGPDNFFLSRYAFIAMPIGNAMDLNYIHNQVLAEKNPANPNRVNPPASADNFFRNQGVGTWEINLAGFLADLNTNKWGAVIGSPANGNTTFYYYQYLNGDNRGNAFDDARALLAYRYNNDYNSLQSAQSLFGNLGYYPYNIDLYGDEPLQLTVDTNAIYVPDSIVYRWPGADNTNHFFDLTADMFDNNKTATGVLPANVNSGNYFTGRLLTAGTNVDTYDRYTFYRLLSQLGTDSQPDTRMNLNYINVTNGQVVVNMETNLVPWTNSLAFFTNAADRMLRAYSAQWFKEGPSNYLATYYGQSGYSDYYIYQDPLGNVHTNYDDPTGVGLTNVPYYGLTNQALSFDLTHIPVVVNNKFVYSSSVNRILQLAANLYDATTTNEFPSVFRPLFTWSVSNSAPGLFITNLFISGYTNVDSVLDTNDLRFLGPFDLASFIGPGTYFGQPIQNTPINVYGIPWIIGAKKGLPNFNKFSVNDSVEVARMLEVARAGINGRAATNYVSTNSLYNFSVGTSMGVQFWNSYASAYSNDVVVVWTNSMVTYMMETNGGALTMIASNNWQMFDSVEFDPTLNQAWPGSAPWGPFNNPVAGTPQSASFVFQTTNVAFLNGQNYDWYNHIFEREGTNDWTRSDPLFQQLPHLILNRTHRFRSFMLARSRAGGLYHVVDYVQLAGPDSSRDLWYDVQTLGVPANYTNMWSYSGNVRGVPYGLQNQVDASRSSDSTRNHGTFHGPSPIPLDSSYWKTTYQPYEIDGFYTYMGGDPRLGLPLALENATATNLYKQYLTNIVRQVPYTPYLTVYDYTTWQANDPLVHYTASDLNFAQRDASPPTGVSYTYRPPISGSYFGAVPNMGSLNERYQPWGRQRSHPFSDNNPYNLAFKDPLVYSSDYWDFPTNKLPAIGWIGRVHRGTPWQTVYLKASNILAETNSTGGGGVLGANIGIPTWTNWVGEADSYDAQNSSPGQDRLLFDLFTTSPNDNSSRGQLSINVGAGSPNPDASLAAWSALFSGMVTLTNTTPSPAPFAALTNLPIVIQPAGPAGLGSPLGLLARGIYDTRTNFENTDHVKGVFEHVGDILAVPQLSERSPFLNWAGQNQANNGIYDELYEWLPQQAMGLLRVSSAPRYAIYCYGQALKPAQNALVTSGNYFGMCTNYVPVAETAIRVVIRIDDANTTHPHAVVESYNILPPE